MKITASLALSHVKNNKQRSIGIIIAIIISTALVTSIMCFITSGYKMLTNFFGPSLGDYSVTYTTLYFIPALLFVLLIIYMSVTVISNIFEASSNKRLKDYGTLKCVGGTKKQIRETSLFEGIWLSLVGIPLGLIVGTILGFIVIYFASRYVSFFNNLSKEIIMRPFTFELSFHIA